MEISSSVLKSIMSQQIYILYLLSCFVVLVLVVLIISYLLQVHNSVQTPAAQRYTTASMSDTHDPPASSSLYLWLYSALMNCNSSD